MTAILAILFGTLCAADPATVRVIIENHARFELKLHEIVDDEEREIRDSGTAAEVIVELPRGMFLVEARGDGVQFRLPLPLPRRALVPSPLRFHIHRPPSAAVPEFAFIPSGPALIGDVLGVGQEDERPASVLFVPAFWIGKREVSNREFVEFLNSAESPDPAWANLESQKAGFRRTQDGRFVAVRGDEPAVTVSWHGAAAYCAWLTRRTGVVHRLPTEVEWEKAARGPESFTYAYGNIYGVAKANQESGRICQTATFAPNGFGIFDLTGNVFEWTSVAYDRAAPSGAGANAGGGVTDSVDDGTEPLRVLRGGSYVLDGMYLRNSFRMRHRPTVNADDFGFRIVREPATSKQGG